MSDGRTQDRFDAREKVTGTAVYTEDIDLQDMVYGMVLRSPYAHARVQRINTESAQSLSGVITVLTGYHLEKEFGRVPEFRDQPVLATDKVRYEGEAVAAVVAVDLLTAQEACDLIEIDYQELSPLLDPLAAFEEGAPLIHEDRPYNLCAEWHFERGDINATFHQAQHHLEETYTFPRLFHYPLECVGVCLARVDADRMDLWSPDIGPFATRQKIAEMLSVDPAKVRVQVPFIGGSFGSKCGSVTELIAVLLAKEVRRPVKIIPSMRESFRITGGAGFWHRLKTGVTKDGKIIAQEVEILIDGGSYGGSGARLTKRAFLATGPYDIPNLKIQARCVYTNKPSCEAYRGFAGQPLAWGYESHMDSLAHLLGLDPAAFRERNLLQRGDSFFPGTLPLDTDYKNLLRQAVDAIGWQKKDSLPGTGKGLACTIRHGGTGKNESEAHILLDSGGKVKVTMSGVEVGQGLHTMVAEIVARELGLPYEKIRIQGVDTGTELYFAGTSGSKSTVAMGRAVAAAVADLKRKLVDLASKVCGGEERDWKVEEGNVVCRHKGIRLGLQELVGRLGTASGIRGKGSFQTPRSEAPIEGVNPYWQASVGAAEVAVDRETGEIRLLRYVTVVDAGQALHRASCRGQIYGAATMALGPALFEEVVYQDGQMVNGNSLNYKVPLLSHLPDVFQCILVENGDGPGPFGSKGLGEAGIIPLAPAIANAVRNAVGVRLRDLPLVPEKVLRALKKFSP